MEWAQYGFLALYTVRRSWRIVALELVDPARFQALHDKRFYLGYWTGFVPDYFPIRFEPLDIDADELLSFIIEGIAQHGHPAPDRRPQTTYQQPTF